MSRVDRDAAAWLSCCPIGLTTGAVVTCTAGSSRRRHIRYSLFYEIIKLKQSKSRSETADSESKMGSIV